MPRPSQDITEAEQSVLEILWDQGPTTIRRITDTLYPNGRQAHYATVQKLLERLEGKGWARCDRSAAINVFAATLEREALLGRRLQALAEELCGGSWTPLLTHLVQNQKLSVHDRQTLRQLIDNLDAGARRKERP